MKTNNILAFRLRNIETGVKEHNNASYRSIFLARQSLLKSGCIPTPD